MEWSKVITLKYTSIEQRRNRKAEQDKTDSYERQVKTSEMVDQIEEDKTNRVHCIISVLLDQRSKNISGDEWVEQQHFKTCFVRWKLLGNILLDFVYELFYEVVLFFSSIVFI